jgi:lipopolysaccharide transport protein LptA
MLKAFIKMKKNKLIFSFLIFISAFAALAEEPAQFKSTQANYNLKTRESVFEGQVIMTQGENKLLADKVITYRNPQGKIYKIIAYGKPVIYYIYDTNKSPTQARAFTLEYYPLNKRAILIGGASITQENKTIKAPRIIYDLLKHEIIGQSNAKERSSLIFTPDEFKQKEN